MAGHGGGLVHEAHVAWHPFAGFHSLDLFEAQQAAAEGRDDTRVAERAHRNQVHGAAGLAQTARPVAGQQQ